MLKNGQPSQLLSVSTKAFLVYLNISFSFYLSKGYKQEIEKLNTQMDAIIKVDNKIIEHRLKELTLQRETLEHVTRT